MIVEADAYEEPQRIRARPQCSGAR
jgi:hypothetical protein